MTPRSGDGDPRQRADLHHQNREGGGDILPGLCSITFRHLGADEVLDLAVACGLTAIEWGGDVHVPAGDLALAERVGARSRDAGIALLSYGSYLRAGALGADDEVARTLDTAAALGAPNVRVWTEWTAVDATPPERRQAIAADLAAIAAAGGERGLTVSLEAHAHTLTETAASTRRLLDEAGSPPNLFTYWQPMDGLSVDVLLGELDAVAADLSHLHVFRWRSFDDRLPLADGADLWPAALDQVRTPSPGSAPRWRGPRAALLEYVRGDDPDQLRHDADTLRRWLTHDAP